MRRSVVESLRRLARCTYGNQWMSGPSQIEAAGCSTRIQTLSYSHTTRFCQDKSEIMSWLASTKDARHIMNFQTARHYSTAEPTKYSRQIYYPEAEVAIGQPAPDFTAPGRHSLAVGSCWCFIDGVAAIWTKDGHHVFAGFLLRTS